MRSCTKYKRLPWAPTTPSVRFKQRAVFNKSRSMTITGLTPGTIYAIQVRALGGSTGSGDWSDAVTHMCM
ncbi:MAG: hypothetical protein DMG18_06830 [Acidobacteria bacterium]|nr:MAG: hypothetical protein DMG18_06830 [Acidobacteriota bacterium]